jgi:uncharacterized protein
VLESFSGCSEANLAAVTARINANSMFIRITDAGLTSRPPNSTASGATTFTGGEDSKLVFTEALETLTTVQGISLIAVPDTPAAGDLKTQAAAINEILEYCEKRADLFCVVDPAFGLDVQGVMAFKSGQSPLTGVKPTPAINSSYGAMYYPWVDVYYGIAGVNVTIPPSGPVLGRYAATDLAIGVFKSPAGVKDGALRTVSAPATLLTDSDQDVLNPQGINAIRNLINYGNLIWGARTLSLGGDWDYVSVRRFFIFVEQSLHNSLQWVVFEPNDQRLWAKVIRDIGAFLNVLWRQGAIFGSTSDEAFFIICDETNNPPEERALGMLHIDIGIAPVYPAEFVIISLSQKTGTPVSGS